MQTAASPKIDCPARLIEDSVHIIRQFVVRAFRHYNYATNEDEISDTCQQIMLLLIEDNYRRLCSFDSRKSSYHTWLNSVVRHYVSNYIQRQRKTLRLDDLMPESVSCPPTQEDSIILRGRNQILEAILDNLSNRDQQIIRLLYLDGVSAMEVARVMRIKVGSVYWHKHMIMKRLRDLITHC